MTSRQRAKGNRAELDAVAFYGRHWDWPVRRRLQEGRRDDTGDLEGVPYTCVQVAAVDDLLDAISHKLPELAKQRERCRAPWGVLLVRRRGGRFIAVMDEAHYVQVQAALVAYAEAVGL